MMVMHALVLVCFTFYFINRPIVLLTKFYRKDEKGNISLQIRIPFRLQFYFCIVDQK